MTETNIIEKYIHIFEQKIRENTPEIQIDIVYENNAIIVNYYKHESTIKVDNIMYEDYKKNKDYTNLFWWNRNNTYNSIVIGLPITATEYLELKHHNLLSLFQNIQVKAIQ